MKTGTGLFPVHRVGSGTFSVSLLVQGIQYDKIEIKSENVAPNLYMLSGSENVDPGHPDGAGGRIGVCRLAGGAGPHANRHVAIGSNRFAPLVGLQRLDTGQFHSSDCLYR